MRNRPRLLFVSPRFLFPADSGGKIRSSQILRNLHGGEFHVKLLSAASPEEPQRYRQDIEAVCDEFAAWPAPASGPLRRLRALPHLFSALPMPVATDRSRAGQAAVAAALAEKPDVVVFDFLHSAVLAPATLRVPSVLFTHNVEAEIFQRHHATASGTVMRRVWAAQHRRMLDYERSTLSRFDRVIAVSERDKEKFAREYGISHVDTIPTGVDLEFFACSPPTGERRVVFTGSMDWIANIDAMDYFMDEVWPLIVRTVPEATMTVVGRAAPQRLIAKARERGYRWTFTGFVDDVRPHVRGADAFAIPLRVGGGTRIKAFEAMAMGIPVVSTSIGIEGLAVEAGVHFERADSAADFAAAVVRLLTNAPAAQALSSAARQLVDRHFSNRQVARCFEAICQAAANLPRPLQPRAVAVS